MFHLFWGQRYTKERVVILLKLSNKVQSVNVFSSLLSIFCQFIQHNTYIRLDMKRQQKLLFFLIRNLFLVLGKKSQHSIPNQLKQITLQSFTKMKGNDTINRRQFLKRVAGGAATMALVGCASKETKKETSATTAEIPTDKMTCRPDKYNKPISLLGYGCMRFPTKAGISGREDKKNELDQEQINKLVDYAIEHGVNLFDTSPAYCQGRSEGALGIALSRHDRSKYHVSTKLSNFGNYSREASIEMYRNSMKEMQVDYIDFYLLHSVNGQIPQFNARFVDNGMIDFLMEEKKAGRIRNLGFSFHSDKKMFDYMMELDNIYHWDFVLIQHNYIDWKYGRVSSEYMYTEMEKRNIPAFVMEPLLGGRLATLNNHATELLKERKPESSIASWAFRFAGSQPKILSVLSGMTYLEHLQDNIRTYSPLEPLSDDEYKLLQQIADIYVNYPLVGCTECQYCMPCPYGLDIPSIFAHYNKCLNEGLVVEDRLNPEYKKARQAFLIGYDRKVPRLRQANHCIGCDKCKPACPQHINIPLEMRRINKFVEALKVDGADLGYIATLATLLRQLDNSRSSCVISNNGEVRSFNQRGVIDLYTLVDTKDPLLKGALMADKIVGKGAAALMVLGGIKALNTHAICTSALKLLQDNGIKVFFDEEIDHIETRTKTDWCPLEKRVKDAPTAEDCWPIIVQFISDLRAGLI